MKQIYVTKSSIPSYEEYIEEIKQIFETHNLTNMGVLHKELQNELIEYLNVKDLSLFVNGHFALEMAIEALGLKRPGGEVITTPFTFVSTVHAIARNGLKPVFCDIKKNDYTIDENLIESLINSNTVAIIPVHVYGRICNVKKIYEIAKKHNLKVIYDGAHAFGVKYNGIGIGNYGDACMFSFHATKVFNTIEGGAISFANPCYKEKLNIIKNFGIMGPEDISLIGANAKMDEFRAAMGICNLRHIDEYISKREKVYKKYVEKLNMVEGIELPGEQKNVESNYSYFPIYVNESYGMSRDELFEMLKKNGIYARKYFYPAINEIECYKHIAGYTPIAHDVSRHILTLPMYSDLEINDVEMICDLIKKKGE